MARQASRIEDPFGRGYRPGPRWGRLRLPPFLFVLLALSPGFAQTPVPEAGMVFIGASNPRDQIFVVNFNDKVHRGLPESVAFTDDLKAGLRKIHVVATAPIAGNSSSGRAPVTGCRHERRMRQNLRSG